MSEKWAVPTRTRLDAAEQKQPRPCGEIHQHNCQEKYEVLQFSINSQELRICDPFYQQILFFILPFYFHDLHLQVLPNNNGPTIHRSQRTISRRNVTSLKVSVASGRTEHKTSTPIFFTVLDQSNFSNYFSDIRGCSIY